MVIPDNGSGKLEGKANSFAWSEIFKKPLITFLSATCTVNAFISTSLYHHPLSANWWCYCSISAENCILLDILPPLLLFYSRNKSGLSNMSRFGCYWSVMALVASVSLSCRSAYTRGTFPESRRGIPAVPALEVPCPVLEVAARRDRFVAAPLPKGGPEGWGGWVGGGHL